MSLDLELTSDPSKGTFKDDVAKVSGEGVDVHGDEKRNPAKAVEEGKILISKSSGNCDGTAEDYLKWAKSLQTIFRGKPCTSHESKYEMTGLILYGNLKDTWDTLVHEHISVMVNRTFRMSSGEEHKMDFQGVSPMADIRHA